MNGPDHRSVVVTGASAGVGRAIALRFAKAGARLSLIGRSAAGLAAAKAEIEALGGQAIALPLDVSDADAVMRGAAAAAAHWGGVDVWVNNAMVTMFAPLSQVSPEEFRRITEVTYLGCVFGSMAALGQMRPRDRGVIMQIGSALSYRAIPLQAAYCGAKFAVRGFTEALRAELLHEGSRIRVTMLQLPAVNTPQFDWARSTLPRRPQPVPPIFQPEAIAGIAYDASHDPPPEIWIGGPALKLIAGSMAAPGVLEHYLAGTAYEAQMTDEAQEADRPGNLFEPAAQGHATRGRFSAQAKPRVTAIDPILARAGVAAVAAGLLVGAWLGGRGRR